MLTSYLTLVCKMSTIDTTGGTTSESVRQRPASNPAANERPSAAFFSSQKCQALQAARSAHSWNGFDQRLAPPAVCKCHTCHVEVA
jgi:hypothetical protein